MAKKTEKTRPGSKQAPPVASALVLDRLWTVILQRRNADPAVSHSARLLGRGTAKVAQKFGEEAVECLIEAVTGNVDALVSESADVLYHLLVLWVAGGIDPAMVWAELERREGVSGIAEKAARSLPKTVRASPKASPKAAKASPKPAKSSAKAVKKSPLAHSPGTRKIP